MYTYTVPVHVATRVGILYEGIIVEDYIHVHVELNTCGHMYVCMYTCIRTKKKHTVLKITRSSTKSLSTAVCPLAVALTPFFITICRKQFSQPIARAIRNRSL